MDEVRKKSSPKSPHQQGFNRTSNLPSFSELAKAASSISFNIGAPYKTNQSWRQTSNDDSGSEEVRDALASGDVNTSILTDLIDKVKQLAVNATINDDQRCIDQSTDSVVIKEESINETIEISSDSSTSYMLLPSHENSKVNQTIDEESEKPGEVGQLMDNPPRRPIPRPRAPRPQPMPRSKLPRPQPLSCSTMIEEDNENAEENATLLSIISTINKSLESLQSNANLFIDESINHNTTDSIGTEKLGAKDLFDDKTGLPRLQVLKDHLERQELLEEEAALRIINEGAKILKSEPNVVRIDPPITICGDVHGHFYDLLNIFEIGGEIDKRNYLFLGNYIGRRCFGIEIVLYLWASKIHYPKTFFLLRGNHECRHLSEYFAFKQECFDKYSAKVYEACMKAFDSLPLAAVVNKQFFCVHGGLSPYLSTIKDTNEIDRFIEPPSQGPMCDLLWSDPSNDYGEDEPFQYTLNTVRGCSYFYSYKAVCKFLNRNDLLGVIRAHEVQEEGFKMYHATEKNVPSLFTLFSAQNYLGVYDNEGTILVFDETNIEIKNVGHPDRVPNFWYTYRWLVSLIEEISKRRMAPSERREMLDELCQRLRKYNLSIKNLVEEYPSMKAVLVEKPYFTFNDIKAMDAIMEEMPPR